MLALKMMTYQISITADQQTTGFTFEGAREALTELLDRLEGPGRTISLSSGESSHGIPLPVLHAPTLAEEITLPDDGLPLLVWNRTDATEIQEISYQTGALCVLPRELTAPPLLSALRNANLLIGALGTRQTTALRFKRQFNRGERIHLEEDRVIRIGRGVMRCTSIHPDGSEVLIGFYGPGDVLVAHDAHSCHVEMTAHTSLTVTYERWSEASRQPDFYAHLKERICQMERWSSMQARPVLEERLMGLLQVIAGKFSQPDHDGVLLGIKITHEQLAGAVGATRTTVTRLLGNLRKAGRLQTRKTSNGEFFLLIDQRDMHCRH
ncbi:MAG: Crp/Fnr family transcriptional regulator [Acidobacteriota bacterium]|nr:Crp/Fnr family transcriptional regulator [Acidobacteriota bacterium]